jgi:glycopeptide antibiotics resistance protein
MFGRVPMLPVVVPMTVALFALLLWVLHRRGRLAPARGAVAAAAAVYAGGVVANTVFPIFLAWPRSDGPEPLPLNLVPVVGYEVADAVTNALVFVPLGILVALMLARPTWARTIAVTTGVSAAVEATQFVTARFAHGGHIADVNDLASNVLGGAVGYALYAVAMRQPALARVVERFRWHREVTA